MNERIDTEMVLHKLERATRGVRTWWPFPLHTQRGIYRIFEQCRIALAQEIADHEADRERLEETETERDLAIAHDRQPYPTVAAYETVCAARTKWQERAEKAEARIETAEQIFRSILAMDEYEEVAMPKVLVMARNWLGLPCPHENTIMEMRGSRRLVDGQVDDDLHEVEVCKDCGADLAAEEER